MVLYEGITGEQVRRGKTFEQQVKLVQSGNLVPPSRLNVAVGPALDEVLQRALAPDRSKRYANAREFAVALGEAASPFMWRPKLRAQFINKHFDERRRQDESLCQMISRIPPRVVAPAPVRSQTLAGPSIIPSGVEGPLVIASRSVSPRQLSRPSAPRSAKKVSSSRTLAPLVGILSALLGFVASTVELSPAPPLPVVTVVRLAAVVLVDSAEPVELQVERVVIEPPSLMTQALASIEPAPVQKQIVTQVRKAGKRVVRRPRDEAPMPAWLVKRSRR